MTYGLKYYGEFKDYFNNLIRVEISERHYSGSSSEMVMAENPVQLDYPGDEFDVYRPIFGSQLIISVISITDFQYISLHTADARQYQVTVLKDSVLFWKGWIIPDLFNEPYIAPPYVVNISARCGLGELENVPVPEKVMSYGDGSTPVLKSFVNHYSILTHGLRLLNLGLNIKEAINIYNAERTTEPIDTDTTLTDTYIDLTQYSEQTLYELISDVLRVHTARLYQQDGFWWMVRQKELNATLRYRILDIDGGSVIGFDDTKLTTFLIGKVQNNHIVNNGPELRINPAWKEFVIKSIKEKQVSILKNHDFSLLNYIQAGFAGTRRNEYRYEAYPEYWDRFAEVSISTNGLRIQRNQNNNWTKYIYQEVDIEATEKQALRIRINCAPIVDRNLQGVWPSGSGAKTSFAFGLNNKEGLNVKYLHFDDYGFAKWEDTSNVIVVPDVETIGYQQDNVKTFELIAKGIPITGKLSFALFGAQNTSLLVKSVEITLLEIVNPDDPDTKIILREFDESPETTVIVNENNSFIPSPIEVYGGDLPDVPNANKIWKFGYNEVNGTRTRIWNNFGETNEIPLLQHLANDYKKMYLLPQWVLSLPILSENIKFDSSIVDYQVLSKKYRCVSASFNLRDSICEGIFAEVGAWEGDGTGNQWILKTGYWNDNGIWIDTEVWQIPE
jgi:hypothetical protein